MFTQAALHTLYSRKMILHGWKFPSSVCVESRFGQVWKRPTVCPIKTLNLTKEAFQNKNTSVQSRLGELGLLILTPEYLIIMIIILYVSMGSSPLPTYIKFTSATVRILVHATPKSDKVWTYMYLIYDTPLSRSVQLRSFSEIVLNSPFLCMNGSPIRYDFRASAKATQYSVNIALRLFWTFSAA